MRAVCEAWLVLRLTFSFLLSWWLSRLMWPCTITSWLICMTHSSRSVQKLPFSIFSRLLMIIQHAYWYLISLLTDSFCLFITYWFLSDTMTCSLLMLLIAQSHMYISRPLGTLYPQAWLGYFLVPIQHSKPSLFKGVHCMQSPPIPLVSITNLCLER